MARAWRLRFQLPISVPAKGYFCEECGVFLEVLHLPKLIPLPLCISFDVISCLIRFDKHLLFHLFLCFLFHFIYELLGESIIVIIYLLYTNRGYLNILLLNI